MQLRDIGLGVLAITALAASNVRAAVTFTSSAFDSPPVTETMAVDFDTAPAAGYSITGGHLHMGPLVPGVAAPPTGDLSEYLAVYAGETATLMTPLLSSLSVYLGSIDSYNTITFMGPGGFSQSFTGSQLVADPNGDQSAGATNRRFTFNFGANAINEVLFKSGGNSFEFDNIAGGAVASVASVGVTEFPVGGVPEPMTWLMLIAGAGMVGAALRRSVALRERSSLLGLAR